MYYNREYNFEYNVAICIKYDNMEYHKKTIKFGSIDVKIRQLNVLNNQFS